MILELKAWILKHKELQIEFKMILNENAVVYKVVLLFETYNIDTKFVSI